MPNNIDHQDRQKAFEKYAFNPILNLLGLDISCVNFDEERPDIRFIYNGKHIGLEIVDCYPSKFDIATESAVNNLYEEIEEVLTAKGLVGDYRLCLKETIYRARINSIKRVLISEVESVINGNDISTTSYIDSLEKSAVTLHTDRLKIHPYERYMRIVQTPPSKDIIRCIDKKDALLSKYIEQNSNIDEYWLLIYIPTNENYCSAQGVMSLETLETGYKKIFVTDYQQRVKIIYEK